MIESSLSGSVCLISNRSDTISFCERSVGIFTKINIESIFSVRIFNFFNIVLVDASVFINDYYEKPSTDHEFEVINKNAICLLPLDCPIEKKEEIYCFFERVIPIPCDCNYLANYVQKMINTLVPSFFATRKLDLLQRRNCENAAFNHFYGNSKVIRELREQILLVAQTDVPVLLVGETGTGKTTVAEIIHKLSKRKNFPFKIINIPVLAQSPIVSDLFGNTKGAYTDAEKRKGLFKSADGGSIFFDEIGFAPESIQAVLLTALESGKIRTMGSDIDEDVNIRFIFATNANVKAMKVSGEIRADFFHRIAKTVIQLPPLREHLEDLEEIIKPILQENHKTLDKNAYEKMMNYNWPGNVRELQSCIERACMYCQSEVITADFIMFDI